MVSEGELSVLGLESSCDESAAAIVRHRPGRQPEILSNCVLSQTEEHKPFGGVVPEIAARAHIEHMDGLIVQAMDEAGLSFQDLDGIAATAGPGLIGGVIVGLMTGKGLALTHDKPLIGVNHLEGHALSVRLLEPELSFPYLLLLISGGHCQLLSVEGVGVYTRLGTTLDDAVGEAFDKTAKLIGLGYPGGPAVEKAARQGDALRFSFPRPLMGREGCDFSFSGLKTAVRQAYEAVDKPEESLRADIAASFQAAVSDVLVDRTAKAMSIFEDRFSARETAPHLVVAGGVAANQAIAESLQNLCAVRGFEFSAPPPSLCTDNGAMIAWAGLERLRLGLTDAFSLAPKARWPLDTLSSSTSL